MTFRLLLTIWSSLLFVVLQAQSSRNIKSVSVENDRIFDGFELLNPGDNQIFVLAEHWHNIGSAPKATMKVLQYLHKEANVRILAIEQGTSVALMINQYLNSGDTTILRKVTRNTMFWGRENFSFFEQLYAFNQSKPPWNRVEVKSIDIEYKMESAVYMINDFIGQKKIPSSLEQTVGLFKLMFEETRQHRESFNGLAVMFYYDREIVTQLVQYTLDDIKRQPQAYQEFFGEDYMLFTQMIQDMVDGLYFDYTNPNGRYKFRDELIEGKFLKLIEDNPEKGIFCVIGMRHTSKGSSLSNLDVATSSPVKGKVMNIRFSALLNKKFNAPDLRRVNFAYPNQLRENSATLIKHDPEDPTLDSKRFDYTLFINDSGNLTPFNNVLREN